LRSAGISAARSVSSNVGSEARHEEARSARPATIIRDITGIKTKSDVAKCISNILRSPDADAGRFYYLLSIELRLRTVETDRRLAVIEKALGIRAQRRSAVPARLKPRSMVQH
jgi:hypothetical protein